ncbi:MAG: efflux RND transporter periplasmic adaptor subunit [Deltaproteobacteria bacterium]|nr:efflux RND transporter periplasmic adaptor subunit [Deltaproteobacteria bacterium]
MNATNEFQQGHEAPPPGVRFMAVFRWLLVLAMAGVAVFAVARYVRSGDGETEAGATKRLYQCPMHPQIISPQPGECPICGMTLVLVKEDDHKHDTNPSAVKGLVPIQLTAERIQTIGVKTAKASLRDVPNQLRTVGLLEANERGRVAVVARFSGFVEALYVNETGQAVVKGQPIAKIYSPEVLQAQEEFLNAQQWNTPGAAGTTGGGGPTHPGHVQMSSDLLHDARRRLELLGLAPQDIDDIAARKQTQATVLLRAPSSGSVISKNILSGAAIERGAQLLEIADLSVLWLIADVYEGDLARVKLGNPATFNTAAFAGESFLAKVQFVYPTVDAAARTLRVRLELRNPKSANGVKLRPGMYGDVVIETASAQALMVPAEAAVDTGNAQYVFIAESDGRFTPQPVKLGARRGDFVEVIEGLKPDQEVVTTANFLLDSESRLQAAVRGQK